MKYLFLVLLLGCIEANSNPNCEKINEYIKFALLAGQLEAIGCDFMQNGDCLYEAESTRYAITKYTVKSGAGSIAFHFYPFRRYLDGTSSTHRVRNIEINKKSMPDSLQECVQRILVDAVIDHSKKQVVKQKTEEEENFMGGLK